MKPLRLLASALLSFALFAAATPLRAAGRDSLDAVARDYVQLVLELGEQEALRRIERYGLMSRARAEQSLAFIEHYRAYVINYGLGRDLVAEMLEAGHAAQGERWTRLGRLLSEPFRAGDLPGARPFP